MTRRRLLPTASVLLAGVLAVLALRGREAVPGSDAPPTPAPAASPAPTAPPDPWAAPASPTSWATRYTRFETVAGKDVLPSERVTCLLAEDQDLAVGTEHGLALRRGGAWSVIGEAEGLRHAYVTAVARQATTGDLWVGTLAGLHRVSGGKVQAYTQTNSGLMNDIVYHLAVAGDLVWAGTAAGTSVLDVRTGSWSLWDNRNAIMHEPWCYALALGPGKVWIGVWGGGVVERDLATGLWREYRDPDGELEVDLLRDDGAIHEVTSFVAYDEGLLWQSSYFGLARFDGRHWNSWVAKEAGFAGDFIVHVAAKGRTAWLSTDQGLSVFDGETCVTYRRDEDGTCLVTTWAGGRETGRTSLPTAPADNYLLWAQPGPSEVWLATGHGLSRGVAEPAGAGR